jgi:hypothetical protein
MGYEHKGYKIIKTWRHGYTYYKIEGEKDLYTTRKAAIAEIDRR